MPAVAFRLLPRAAPCRTCYRIQPNGDSAVPDMTNKGTVSRPVISKGNPTKPPIHFKLQTILPFSSGYKVSYFDNFSMNLIPKEAYCSPPPRHMPLTKRRVSNQIANQPRPLGVYRQDMPLATIIARWDTNKQLFLIIASPTLHSVSIVLFL